MTSQEIVAEIVAIFDREQVPDLAAAMILTEVAGRRVFKDAVIISTACGWMRSWDAGAARAVLAAVGWGSCATSPVRPTFSMLPIRFPNAVHGKQPMQKIPVSSG
jgi:hypothetical protein